MRRISTGSYSKIRHSVNVAVLYACVGRLSLGKRNFSPAAATRHDLRYNKFLRTRLIWSLLYGISELTIYDYVTSKVKVAYFSSVIFCARPTCAPSRASLEIERMSIRGAAKSLSGVLGPVALFLFMLRPAARPPNPLQVHHQLSQVFVNGAEVTGSPRSAGSTQGTTSADLPVLQRIRASIINWESAAAANNYSGKNSLKICQC